MGVPRYSGASKHFVVSIGSLDEPEMTVHAQYRPKELEVTQPASWAKHATTAGSLQLEFGGGEGRSTSLELFLDESEVPNGTVMQRIDMLTTLTLVRSDDPKEKDDQKKRPHHCVLVFGDVYDKRPLQCVIESLTTKYTMFSPEGAPIRAIATLKLKEAKMVDRAHLAQWDAGRASRDEKAREREREQEANRDSGIDQERERQRKRDRERAEEEERDKAMKRERAAR